MTHFLVSLFKRKYVKIPRAIIPALAIALLSFPVWQQIFIRPDLPIQVQIAASESGTVKAYWDNPTVNPTAYEEILVKPVQLSTGEIASNIWHIKVEALAEKELAAKSAEVWLADMRTPEYQINWAEVSMGEKKWNLLDNAYGPQGKLAAAQARQPQSLEAVVKGSDLTITLWRSAWSGKVRVTANNQVREISLYSAIPAVETLSFTSPELENKRTKTYEMKVVKTPWHRLKFVSESTPDLNRIRVKSIHVGDKTILPDSNSEFVLPFYFWNPFTCAIAATSLSFLGLVSLLVVVSHWQWFDHRSRPMAILKIKIAKQQFLILPYQSFKYLFIGLAILTSGLLLIEGYFYRLEASKVVEVRSAPRSSVSLSWQKNHFVDLSLLTTSASQAVVEPEWHGPRLASLVWQQEDKRIFRNNNKKILTSGDVFHPTGGDWVWRSRGFPVSQVAQKPNRILVMGDSFVWGDGYSNMNDIWWRQLQRELIHRGYNDVEVIADGLNGASTHQELEQAQNLTRIYKPDLIIWGYVSNDPDEGNLKLFDYSLIEKDVLVQTLDAVEARGVFPRVSTWLAVARSSKIAQAMSSEKNGYDYLQWEQKLFEPENFKLYQQTIDKLGIFQSRSGIPGFIMTLPSLPIPNIYTSNYSKVLPLFQSAKVPVYNILDNYLDYYSSLKLDPIYGWRINPANGHPSAASTYFHAVKAADILEANYSQVLGKRQPSRKQLTIQVNDWVPHSLNPTSSMTGVFTFQYPTSEEYMLRLPVNRPFVQLNLEIPVALKEIRLSGVGLEAAVLDLTVVDPKLKFDNGTIYSMDSQQGNSLMWNLEDQAIAQSVNTIRLSASFKTNDRTITLSLIPTEAGRKP